MIGDRHRGFRILLRLVLLVTLLVGCAGGGRTESTGQAGSPSLAGQFLVASPQMPDPRFAHAVIFMIRHDQRGAMGVIVNRDWGTGPLRALLDGFGITAGLETRRGRRATTTTPPTADEMVRLYEGGPVQQDHGFVLHSADYAGESTLFVGNDVALSAGADVLRALAAGQGPHRRLILLGYAGWGPGQIENELARDDWFTAPASADEVFSDHPDTLWQDVLRTAGTPL